MLRHAEAGAAAVLLGWKAALGWQVPASCWWLLAGMCVAGATRAGCRRTAVRWLAGLYALETATAHWRAGVVAAALLVASQPALLLAAAA